MIYVYFFSNVTQTLIYQFILVKAICLFFIYKTDLNVSIKIKKFWLPIT